mmetsp:Transcript_56121/g.149758  ORF Transcript_56121/g.149758 Transcript_56121/m.149758 type:complete len:173 (-) Transcript_56121:41-559(-)|eukprot:CAMPEP_0194548354 /NCGR_PEP_ID=MMETSP0253-20130528/93496_1 /TAXON_ID=2966 /ORGANISM="Noctiluca scintillans" /LENGTH=172 /DNA_ID=CAMNT_0039395655 /DNA_START=80 /DNA_END=598 /DNA_ORIENTATION=+
MISRTLGVIVLQAYLTHGALQVRTVVQSCEKNLLSFVGLDGDDLLLECQARFCDESCDAADLVLNGRVLTEDDVVPVCHALRSNSDEHDSRISSLLRRAVSEPTDTAYVEDTVRPKRGEVDYVVKSTASAESGTSSFESNSHAARVVDLTLAEPPDADGNPYNKVVWYDGPE